MDITELLEKSRRDLADAKDRRKAALAKVQGIVNSAKAEQRGTTDAESLESARLIGFVKGENKRAIEHAEKALADAERIAEEERATAALSRVSNPSGARLLHGASASDDSATSWRYANTDRTASLRRDQAFADHEAVREYASRQSERDRIITGQHGSFGQYLRALSTTGASAVVPLTWSFPIIDRVRNAAVCMKAGATVVPMPSKSVQIGRLTADPTASFKNEGSAVTASDPGYDYITLTSTSLTALTVASIEFLQDSPDAEKTVSDAISKVMALEIDKAALFGQLGATGTNDEGAAYALPAPYPKGLLKNLVDYNSGSQIVGGFPANGTAQTAATPWNEVLATYYKVKRGNEVPNALVSNDALVENYDMMYDGMYQPLRKPEVLAPLPWLTTNAVPSYTRGTMTGRATDLFAGDFSQMLIGQRMETEIRVLTERYAENGQVGILAYWRGDIAIARPGAFAAYRGLQGAV